MRPNFVAASRVENCSFILTPISRFDWTSKTRHVALCVARWTGERGRKGENGVERGRLKTKGMEENRSFRNRQVASSTLALGSRISKLYSPCSLIDAAREYPAINDQHRPRRITGRV